MGWNHEYTWETLFHFLCGECKNWWSYAGIIQKREDGKNQSMTCQHCGHKADIKMKEGFKHNG